MNAFRSDSTWVRAAWRALYPLRLLGLLGLSGYAIAGPTGGQVTTGSGQITQSGTTTTVQQNSQTLGLDWSSFNVAANETVNFVQPGKNSVAVNEILSPGGSEILGHLNANGQVWLINPNGILFGSNAEVNVGGLVASTLAPGASDGTGSTSFSGTGAGSIVNQGTINAAKGGYVALLGNSVSNQGVVRAQLGTAALGAGSAATLTFAGNKLLQIEVDRNTLNALAENKGLIEADGGTVYMTAGAANSLLASSVNTTGVIRAKSVENHDGKIVLGAGLPAGTVTIEGMLDVSSDRGVGGEVTATAGSVAVGPNATVNASGGAGGGAIRIGGGWEGGEGEPQATTVTVADTATLDASATNRGNGGEIVVRSDVADMNSTAEVAGTLLAKGGVNGGNGGRIETSAHVLDVDGITANASAPKGTGGEWLLDPYNVTIGSSTSGNTYSPPNFSPTSSDSTILASTIGTALSGGSSVTITTGSSGSSLGDITVNSPITKASGNTDVTLTLQAADSIVVNQAISNTGGTGKLNVSLLADNDNGTHDGVGSILLNNSISTGGGYIQFGNGATMTLNGVSTLVGGDVYVGGSSAINLTTGGGAVTFNGQTLIANTSGLSINTTGSTNGNVSFGSSIDSADSYTYVSSQMSWNAALAAAASGTGANVGDTFLATPSTRLQNAEASAAAGYQSAWLGGERGGNGNPGGSAIWYWVSGPLGLANGGTGTPFFTQNGSSTTNGSGGTAINGAYTNWNAGEPNNSGGSNLTSSGRGEWVMQFTGAQANWNDLNPTTNNLGYVVETNLAASPLTINTGTGTVSIAGAVGAAKALASLSVNAGSIAVNGTALITNGAQTYNNALTINSSGAFHLSSSALSITNSNQALSLTATGNVTIDGPSSVAGPISIYGGNITIDSGATLTSTAANRGILLNATGGITDGANLTTNGGDITLWANSAGASTGGIQVSNGVTLASSGGAITLGGSANNATIPGLPATSANGTTLPQGYAENLSGTFGGVVLGTYAGTTGENANVTINSGNGNISMAGQSNQYVNGVSIGMYAYEGINVNAGNGNITLNGLSTGATAGQSDFGTTLAAWYTAATAASKWQTNGGNITINGTASGATGTTFGADLQGGNNGTTVTIENTGASSGGITVNGYASNGTSSNYGIRTINTNILSSSGAISLDANAVGSTLLQAGYTTTLGYLANSDVTASSANINLTGDALSISGALNVNSTGTLTVQPYSNSFASALAWPETNLAVGSGLTGLTLGKPGNTANITVSSAQSIAGPISIYGGNIILNAGLTTTSTTTGSVGLTASTGVSGSGNISLASGEALTITQAGNTTYGGVISGSGSSFTNAGAGTLTLTGTNTYTGATTLSAGTLQLGNGGTTGSLATSGVTNNANLAFNLAADTTIPYAIGGSGAVQVTGQQETLFSSFLTTTPVTIATNTTVAEVAARLSGGQMAGNSVLNGTPAQAGVYEVNFNPAANTANFQVQEYEPNGGNYTKVVFVKLTQSGSNVQAVIDTSGNHALGTGYVSGNELGTDLSVGNLSSLGLATSASGNGYGLDALYEAAKITFTGANTYSGLTTISNTTTSVSSGSTSSNPLSYYSQTAPGTLQIGNGGTFGSGNVSDAGLLLFNTTASQTIANTISGSGAVMQSGSGTETLTGANTYTGLTTVNAGKLQIGAGGTLGSISSSSTIDLASSGISFVVDRSDNLSMGNVIAGVGGVEKMGADNLTLTANSSYSGATNIDGGALILQNDAPSTGGTTFNGPGTLTVQSASAAFAGAFSTSGWNFGSTLTGLTLGKTTNTQNMTIAGAASVAGPISIYGGNLAVNAGLTATGINTLSLTGTGNVTEGASGYVSANSLALLGGNVTLTNANNAIGTLAASGVGALTFSDSNALTIGTVGSTNGVSATGAVSIGTATGNLTVAQTVATTNATSSALVLDAGTNTAAGTASGGDIVLSGSPTVSVGTGGTAKLYTGSLSGSTGLGALVGVGSGHFRYDADENTNFATGAWANLGTGIYGIYREQPTITLGVNNQSMTYGNATPTWTFNLGGAQNGDTLGQIFASSPTVAVGGSTSTSGNYTAGSHTLTVSGNLGASDLGYAYTGGSNTAGTLAVGQRTLTVGYTGVNKTYDGTTSATVTTSDNRIANDVLTIAYTAAFADKDVGTNVAVNVSGANLVGTDAGNYAIASTSGSTTANITPFALTVTGSTVTPKTYDGTTAATITGGALNGVFSVDQGYVSLTQSGSFATKNVGTGIAVTATDALVLTGTAAGDYTLTQPTGLTGTITPLALTVTGSTVASKTYDGTTAATITGGALIGVLPADQPYVSLATQGGNFASKNAGTGIAVTATDTITATGTAAGDYTLTEPTGLTANITPFALTVTGSTVTPKTYDGTTTATITGGALNGVFSVDQGYVSLTQSGTFATKNVGTGIAVTATDALVLTGGAVGDYTLNEPTGLTGSITPFALTVTGSTVTPKTYDGTTAATITGGALNGVFSVDQGNVSLTQSGSFATKNVGTGIAVTATDSLVLTGTAAGDYTLTQPTGLTGTITPLALTVTGSTVASKTYDGTTAATITGGALIGVLPADQPYVSLATQGGTFASKNAGTGIAVTATDTIAATGTAAGDYTLTEPTGLTANITPFALTVTGSTVTPKTYDGTTAATITGGALNGVFSVDQGYVSLTQSGTFASKNVGTGIAVTATDALVLTGGAVGDYTLNEPTGLTGSITPFALTVTGSTVTPKTYDGTTAATITGGSLNGVLPADQPYVSLATQAGTFASKNAGTGIAVTATDTITATGTAAGDYTLTQPTGLTGTITPLALTVTGSTVASKTYDGTTAATITGGALNGVLPADLPYVSFATQGGTFASKNAGTGIAVTATDTITATGTAAGDYTLTEPTGLTANITPFALTVTGSTVTPKTYDGTTVATITGGVLNGVFSVDQGYVSLTQSGSFASKNAGTGIAVTATDAITATGTAAGDYTLTEPTGLIGNITPKPITVQGSTGVNKTYDGTTSLASSVTGYGNPTGFINGDAVSVTGGPVYSSADAGSRALLQGTVTLAGTDAGNYALSWVNGSGTISPAPLTVTANADARFIGLTDTAGYNGVSYQGFVAGQTSSVLGGALSITRSNAGVGAAGTYNGVLVPSGLTSNDYNITFVPGNYTIVPADELLVRANNVSTTYGSAPVYAITSVQYLNGNNVLLTLSQTGVNGSTYTYADGVGGTATFTLSASAPVISGSGHLAAGNYAIGDSSFTSTGANFTGTPVFVGELSVDPLGITASATTPPSKTYDGTTSMSGTSIALSGVLSGDRVTGSGIGTFTTKDAGTGLSYSLNGLTLTGADAQDYYLTNGVTAVGNNGTITPLALTVSGSSVATKTYDGTTAATITGGVLNGVVSADQAYVSLATQGGTFASKNAGDAVPVTAFDTLTVTGPAAGDYTLIEPTGLAGTITPLALNVSGSSVTPKTYDGTTAATITGGVLNGVLSADQAYVSLTQSGSFATKNVGTGISVTAADTLELTGSAAGDYTLTEPTGLTGAITPRPVSLSNAETAAAKTYDGTTVATLSGGALSNVVAGDTDGLSLIGTFATPNAGQNIAVTVTLSGADAGNYVLVGAPSLAANIYPAPLVATANPLATPLGAVLPAFTGTFSGFVDGQTLAALEADGYQARWSSSVSNTSAPGRYAITGSFNDYNYSVVQAAANATAFDATLAASSAGPFLGIAIYSLGSLQAASGTATSGTAVGGSAAGATAVDGAAASGTAANGAGLVAAAGGAPAGSQELGSASVDPFGTSASTGTGAGLTLGANATNTASDGTVTLVAVADGSASPSPSPSPSEGEGSAGAVGSSDTPPAETKDNATTGTKNEWRRALGVPFVVVSGGVNISLAH